MTTELHELDSTYLPAPLVPQPEVTASDVEITLPSNAVTTDDGDPPESSNNGAHKDIDPESVYVYANSINPASTAGDGNMVAFDVIFSVSMSTPDTGTSHTFQVVKRICVDKMKMAHEAKMSTPVSVVESVKPEPEKFAMNVSTARFKQLAGLK